VPSLGRERAFLRMVDCCRVSGETVGLREQLQNRGGAVDCAAHEDHSPATEDTGCARCPCACAEQRRCAGGVPAGGRSRRSRDDDATQGGGLRQLTTRASPPQDGTSCRRRRMENRPSRPTPTIGDGCFQSDILVATNPMLGGAGIGQRCRTAENPGRSVWPGVPPLVLLQVGLTDRTKPVTPPPYPASEKPAGFAGRGRLLY